MARWLLLASALTACGAAPDGDPTAQVREADPTQADAGAAPAPPCRPGTGGLCGDQHGTCQGWTMCDERGTWLPCVVPQGCTR